MVGLAELFGGCLEMRGTRWLDWLGLSSLPYDRLNLIANNSRFLILPQGHIPNLASRVLSFCQKQIQNDWLERFGFPLLLLETFVDPERFQGTIYRAANWQFVGYSNTRGSSKMVFVRPLQRNSRRLLSRPVLNPRYQTGAPKMHLTAEQRQSLSPSFSKLPPRSATDRGQTLPPICR